MLSICSSLIASSAILVASTESLGIAAILAAVIALSLTAAVSTASSVIAFFVIFVSKRPSYD